MTERDEAKAVMKSAVKEAIKEFLQEKWKAGTSKLGEWLIGVVAAAILGALVYLILWANGWRQP